MSWRAVAFICMAATFSVLGDVFLKRYSDGRATRDVVTCLALWEICALSWVIAYRCRLPLGAPTAFGQLLVITANCGIGALWFGERLSMAQRFGLGFGAASVLLIGLG